MKPAKSSTNGRPGRQPGLLVEPVPLLRRFRPGHGRPPRGKVEVKSLRMSSRGAAFRGAPAYQTSALWPRIGCSEVIEGGHTTPRIGTSRSVRSRRYSIATPSRHQKDCGRGRARSRRWFSIHRSAAVAVALLQVSQTINRSFLLPARCMGASAGYLATLTSVDPRHFTRARTSPHPLHVRSSRVSSIHVSIMRLSSSFRSSSVSASSRSPHHSRGIV